MEIYRYSVTFHDKEFTHANVLAGSAGEARQKAAEKTGLDIATIALVIKLKHYTLKSESTNT